MLCTPNRNESMSSFFFFKQKTAYELRISDWSSDVCSSDLGGVARPPGLEAGAGGVQDHADRLAGMVAQHRLALVANRDIAVDDAVEEGEGRRRKGEAAVMEIGRASCRERVCQYV